MYLIFAFLIGFIHADGTEPSVDSLYHELLNTPPRGTETRTTESKHFAGRLRQFLELRARVNSRVPITPLLDAMVKYAEIWSELKDIFGVLVSNDNGLGADDVATLMMSGFKDFDGSPLSPARAFQRAFGEMPVANADVDKRQVEIFAGLAAHARDLEEWQELAFFAADWTTFASLTSEALISRQIERLQGWTFPARRWGEVLAYYRPEFIDAAECAAIVSIFTTIHALRAAVARVPEAQVRLCLQEAALRRMSAPSQGEVRTILRPLGRKISAQYRMSLERAEAEHMKRAWRTDCGPLLVAAVNDDPRLPPKTKAAPSFLKVIEGGLK